MTDFILPFIIAALIAVIVIQALERYFFSEQVHKERHDMLKFILSKNVHEYNEVTRVEKQSPEKLTNPDEVDLTEASEEEFNKFIKQYGSAR